MSVSEIIPSTGSQNSGSVEILVEGGKEPYSFTWSDGKTTDKSFKALPCAGKLCRSGHRCRAAM